MNSSTSREIDSSSSSLDSSADEKLILYADPETKQLIKFNGSDLLEVPDLATVNLDDLISEPYFQDNTLLFEKLLSHNFVLCVYPPGSGKSTIATLLKYYVLKDGVPPKIEAYLDGCKFHRKEITFASKDANYKRIRGSGSVVLYMDFSLVEGDSLSLLENSYGLYLNECWLNLGLPPSMVEAQENLFCSNSSVVWNSLSLLRSALTDHFEKNVYIILDSLDNMYNLIASLPSDDSKRLYSIFTKDVSQLFDTRNSAIKIFGFGVSPYLIEEYQSCTVYYVGNEDKTKVGQYFSFSDTSIQNVLRTWNLMGVSLEQCKLAAQFKYNDNVFVNPYLCVSYMKSLKEQEPFAVNISPPSLWMSCIFKEEDLEVLLGVLSGECICKFNIAVTMRSICIIPELEKSRKLYYPLFIFGGFLSCIQLENDTYSLSASNVSAKLLLKHHLDSLFSNKFQSTALKSNDLLNDFVAGRYSQFCIALSKALLKLSSFMSKNQMQYHIFLAGIFYRLEESGYDTDNVIAYGAIRPDSIFKKDDHVIVMEYKHVNLPPKNKAKKARKTEKETLKTRVVKECRSIVTKCCEEQITKYAPVIASKYHTNVQVNLMIFYLYHVILLHCTYNYNNCEFSEYEISASKGYYTKCDLESIKA